jgi:hypothetical protein
MTKIFKPEEYNQKFEELPVKYAKVVRAVDIVVLVGLLGLLVYPYIRFSK